jgi:hypothetical protein
LQAPGYKKQKPLRLYRVAFQQEEIYVKIISEPKQINVSIYNIKVGGFAILLPQNHQVKIVIR